jgi:hypothetical protein
MMQRMWSYEARARPTFGEIHGEILSQRLPDAGALAEVFIRYASSYERQHFFPQKTSS